MEWGEMARSFESEGLKILVVVVVYWSVKCTLLITLKSTHHFRHHDVLCYGHVL